MFTRSLSRLCLARLCFRRFNHETTSVVKPEVVKLTLVLNELGSITPDIAGSVVVNTPIETSLPPIEKRASKEKKNRGARTIKNSLPPSLQYVRDMMDQYKDHVILTQMGSFYELYFEHAEIYAPKLNLTLTSREYTYGKVPFAGFPVQQIGRHLNVLVKRYGYSVAIADQFKKEDVADNETNRFLRRVTRIVTPGTFIDEAFENLQENTYLLSIEFPDNCMDKLADVDIKVGLAWCDVSTGEIFVQQVLLKDLVSAITRIKPREILLDEKLLPYTVEAGKWYPELVELKKYFLKYQKIPSKHRTMDTFYKLFTSGDTETTIKDLDIAFYQLTQKENAALKNVLLYIEEHLPDTLVNLQIPQRQLTSSIMQIDSRTSIALELHSTIRNNNKKGSLLSTIRRTVTPSGNRLLTQWLSGPSLDLKEIEKRQKLVSLFKKGFGLTQILIEELKHVYDMSRILQKFSFGKGEAMELIQLSNSLMQAALIRDIIRKDFLEHTKIGKRLSNTLSELMGALEFDNTFINKVLCSFDEEQLIRYQRQKVEQDTNPEGIRDNVKSKTDDSQSSIGWVAKPEASQTLSKLHKQYSLLLQKREKLLKVYEDIFVTQLQAKEVMLKLKQTNEYAIHLVGTANNLLKISEFIKKNSLVDGEPFHILQKSAQTRWLTHKSWTDLGQQLDLAVMKIRQEENNIINSFKSEFVKKSTMIREISQTLDYLDVLTSFAKFSIEKNLVCPKVDHSNELEILGGRHLVVEDGISAKSLESFTSNNCRLSKGHLWIVTGPNMGGKSTFLRQNAIIVIMAQIGCFVPCESARIGLVDKIFSRVGSADDLYNEMSTFMVEMIETSFILKGATKRSLAILDEIGRGTSGREGVSIAFATLKHLVHRNQCRSLFATHFGNELQHVVESKCDEPFKEKLHFYKSDIVELDKDHFYYDHKLKPGICSKSDAIKVAKIAGFPEEALKTAQSVLN